MNYDSFNEFMMQYPLYIDYIINTSMVIGALIPFGVCAIDHLADRLYERRRSARCYGFHHLTIVGVCRCHSCPYAVQCVFHAPRRTFRVWLSDLFKKKKP